MLSSEKTWAKTELTGHLVILTTPFNDDLSIDYDGLLANVDRLLRLQCVKGFYINSIFNEPTALTLAERKTVAERVIARVPKGMNTVVAVGGVPLQDAIDLAQHAQKIGASILMLWPPIFGHRPRDGVMAYFRAVIESVSMPVSLYRSGLHEFGYYSKDDELKELIEYKHVCAIKEASLSLSKYLATAESLGDQIAVSCPLDEYFTVGRLLLRSKVPDLFLGTSRPFYCETEQRPLLAELRAAANGSDPAAAGQALNRVLAVANELHTKYLEAGSHNVALTKKVTEVMGYRAGRVRPPLTPVSESIVPGIRDVLRTAGLL